MTRPTYDLQLVNNADVARAAYNPREADEFRDEMLKLSLRKFGWLLPAFMDSEAELLSGHQRQRVAAALGAEQVPAIRVRRLPEARRKAVNLGFNRATNDMRNSDSSKDMRLTLESSQEQILAEIGGLPDLDPKSPEFFPCMKPTWITAAELLDANPGPPDTDMMNASLSLMQDKMYTPLVVTTDQVIVNGLGRLPAYISSGFDEIPCSVVEDKIADSMKKLVNLLTMDFTIHKQYADVLRFNSFRRAMGIRDAISVAFRFALYPDRADWDSQATWERWRKYYGQTVLDWGAGLLQDTSILRSKGVDCTPFEPYVLKGDKQEICPESARTLIREFLAKIKAGISFDSIFLNAIFNSVPFLEDRQHIVRILSATCSPKTKLYATALSVQCGAAKIAIGNKRTASGELASKSAFKLDYEPNVAIADIRNLPKVQKYHTTREFWDLWMTGFKWVKADLHGNSCVAAICKDPRPVDPVALRKSIEFEFALPYPTGERMGLVEEALDAYSTRLGIKL